MHSDYEVHIPAALLTIPGKEALNIVEPSEDRSFIEDLAPKLKSSLLPGAQIVQIAGTDSSGGVEAAAMEAFKDSVRRK
jgi:hypothetical protein